MISTFLACIIAILFVRGADALINAIGYSLGSFSERERPVSLAIIGFVYTISAAVLFYLFIKPVQ